MSNAYREVLQQVIGEEVTIDRANTSSVRGKLEKVDADDCKYGCLLSKEGDRPDIKVTVFIAFDDIRGVASTGWNLDAM